MDNGFLQGLSRYGVGSPALGSGLSTLDSVTADVPQPIMPGLTLGSPLASAPNAGGGGILGNLTGGNWLKDSGILGSTDANGIRTDGWGNLALGATSSLLNGWMGMQQYGLAKNQLKEGQRQFDLNYDAQRRTINSELEDRQRSRVASNAGAYESVGSYMDRNGIR